MSVVECICLTLSSNILGTINRKMLDCDLNLAILEDNESETLEKNLNKFKDGGC